MENVDLGFLEPCQDWQVESRLFPSKAGGKPAWLNLEEVPCGTDLKCSICKEIMIFLCQIYAPYEEDDSNFHRTLFIFVCKNLKCCIRNKSDNVVVLRCSLPRENKFYSCKPPNDAPDPQFSLIKWLALCEVCGCVGDKKCSKCKVVIYCSREHQILDWKEKHKKICETNEAEEKLSKTLFPQFEIAMEPEVLKVTEVDEEIEKKKFIELENADKLGTMSNISEEELIKHAVKNDDKAFTKFRRSIEDNPDQVLRYSRGDKPLLISGDVTPKDIPDCEYCGGERQFEFQVMPQMLTLLRDSELDWGVLLVYTCKKSCTEGSISYRKEYIFKQDV